MHGDVAKLVNAADLKSASLGVQVPPSPPFLQKGFVVMYRNYDGTMRERGKYVVQTMGRGEDLELSVVRLGHHGEKTQGRGSYGWADDDKIILASDGPYSKKILTVLKEAAQNIADNLNKGG